MSDPSTPTKVKRSAFTGNQQKQQQELSAKPAINNYVTDTILLIQYKKIYRTLKKNLAVVAIYYYHLIPRLNNGFIKSLLLYTDLIPNSNIIIITLILLFLCLSYFLLVHTWLLVKHCCTVCYIFTGQHNLYGRLTFNKFFIIKMSFSCFKS